MSERKAIVPVRGMTCASRVAHVARALRGVEWVDEVNVHLATEKANVWFSIESVKIGDLAESAHCEASIPRSTCRP